MFHTLVVLSPTREFERYVSAGSRSVNLAGTPASFRGPFAIISVERLRSAGIRILFEPADQPWGERAGYVADPDGNPVLIVAPIATGGG